MPAHRQDVDRLLLAARALPADRRESFLHGVRAADPELGEKLSLLLAASEETRPGVQEATAKGPVATLTIAPEDAAGTREEDLRVEGQRAGPYRMLREVGRGGSGTVFLAERDDQEFRKTVAIKLLRSGTESADILRRFRQERQILASLDHPFIAKLHDGGTTDAGLPYFVMEYVAGRPIDQECDRRRLSIRERLELFRKVCAAVHFAHQSLVVHRDLKPRNILLTEDGSPKLLDFGIAKLLGADPLSAGPEVTLVDARPMTPEYASPEQVLGEPITTASDVYSLGVVLYELLTGHRPHRIRSLQFEDIRRGVCVDEPVKPSMVVGQTVEGDGGEEGPSRITPRSVAEARAETQERLGRLLAGDLDNVVSMAMSKEPQRRYASAAELAEDLRRHLEGLPVLARQDTLSYRTSKFVRRHRAGVAVAAAFLLSLVGFGVAMTVQSARVARQRNLAEREAAKAVAINQFLQKTLGSANPTEGLGRDTTVLEALSTAVGTIGESFEGQPEIQAAVENTIGFTYLGLGRYDEAEPLLRSALKRRRSVLGDEHPDVAESLTNLGGLMLYRGDYRSAEGFFRQALEQRRKRLGRHPDVAASLNDLGLSLAYLGDYAAAEPLYREALAMRRELVGRDDPTVAETLNNLAFLLHDKGDYAAAEPIYREVVAMDRKLLGDEHPNLAIDLDNFASLLDDKGDYAAAEPLFREALEIRRKALGEGHPDVAKSLNNLASMLERKGDYAAARSLYQEAIAIRRKLFDGSHPDLATNLNNLARLLTATGEYEEALRLFRESHRMYRATLGEGHWLLASSQTNLGRCLTRMGRFADAERQLVASRETLVSRLGARHERTVIATDALVALYEAWDRPEKLARLREQLAAEDTSRD